MGVGSGIAEAQEFALPSLWIQQESVLMLESADRFELQLVEPLRPRSLAHLEGRALVVDLQPMLGFVPLMLQWLVDVPRLSTVLHHRSLSSRLPLKFGQVNAQWHVSTAVRSIDVHHLLEGRTTDGQEEVLDQAAIVQHRFVESSKSTALSGDGVQVQRRSNLQW